MQLKKVNSGTLRAIGYDDRTRVLRAEMASGEVFEYTGVSPDLYRRLSGSGSIWSFFRDNIEEEFAGKRVR
jgi:hypothetical protein